jgi:hypothetical protein
MAGFIGLIFNPQAWIACALALSIGFFGGVFKGWEWSRADQLSDHVKVLEMAAEQKEVLGKADQKRANDAEAKLDESQAVLDAVLLQTANASCKLSSSDIASLQHLAAH